MPSPIEAHIRHEIIARHEKGETLRNISDELHMSYETVKKLWQRWVREKRIEPNYEQVKQRGTRLYAEAYSQALTLKREHPGWGAALIRLKLEGLAAEARPSVRTMQRWFREAGLNRLRNAQHPANQFVQRGQFVHQVWAVDAKEGMRLADGSWASWLVVSDEASGAVLHTAVFPPADMEPD